MTEPQLSQTSRQHTFRLSASISASLIAICLSCTLLIAQAPDKSAARSEPSPSLAAVEADFRALYAKVAPSVVAVSDSSVGGMANLTAEASLGNGASAQAGFVLPGGFVVTEALTPALRRAGMRMNAGGERYVYRQQGKALHSALDGLQTMSVYTAESKIYQCDVVGYDMANLLLVLRLPEDARLPGLRAGNVRDCPVGSLVASFGSSFDSILIDQQVSFSIGNLSDRYKMPWRDIYNREGRGPCGYRGDLFEFEGAMNPGEYGGPLVDLHGRVIGLNTPIFAHGRHVGTSVPVDQWRSAFERIVSKEKPPTPSPFGFSVIGRHDVTDRSGRINGKRIVEVEAGSRAEACGLKVDDVIVAVDGLPVESGQDFGQVLGVTPETRWEEVNVGDSNAHEMIVTSLGVPERFSYEVLIWRAGSYRWLTLSSADPVESDRPALEHDLASIRLSDARLQLANEYAGSIAKLVIYDFDTYDSRIPARQARGQATRETFFEKRVGPYSAVVVDSSGILLTADSVLGTFVPKDKGGMGSRRKVFALFGDGRAYLASPIARNGAIDLALLKIDAEGFMPVVFANRDPKIGENLQALSRSMSAATLSVAAGVCSAENREIGRAFQHDIHLGANSFGGLVIGANGDALGIVNQADFETYGQGSGIAYATDGAVIVSSLPKLLAGEFVARPPTPFLGVRGAAQYVDAPGVLVQQVIPASSAAKAGLRVNDIILSINGKDVYRFEDLAQIVLSAAVGEQLQLSVQRGDDILEMRPELGSRD